MNNVFITGYLLLQPIRFSSFKDYFTEIKIIFSHIKDKENTAIALADGETGNRIYELYRKGDYVLIEGEVLLIENERYNVDIVIYVSNIQILNEAIKK